MLNNVKIPIVIPKFLVYYQLQNFVDYTGEEIMYDYSTSFVGKGEVSEILHQKYNWLFCIAFYKDFITPFLFLFDFQSFSLSALFMEVVFQ